MADDRRTLGAGLVLAVVAAAGPAAGWTPETQVVIAREAGRMAPPDLARQIERHKKELRRGALAPFSFGDADRHRGREDGGGLLEQAVVDEIAAAVAAIEAHRPFADVVYQLGVVSHYLADANNPLNASGADPEEPSYFADFLAYAESALPRFPLLFYGLDPGLDARGDVAALAARALGRGQRLYPLVGREYRRVRFLPGVEAFDDRSTAFGVASVSFSRAVSDAALAFRYVWLAAGGADERRGIPAEGEKRLILLPRATAGRDAD